MWMWQYHSDFSFVCATYVYFRLMRLATVQLVAALVASGRRSGSAGKGATLWVACQERLWHFNSATSQPIPRMQPTNATTMHPTIQIQAMPP